MCRGHGGRGRRVGNEDCRGDHGRSSSGTGVDDNLPPRQRPPFTSQFPAATPRPCASHASCPRLQLSQPLLLQDIKVHERHIASLHPLLWLGLLLIATTFLLPIGRSLSRGHILRHLPDVNGRRTRSNHRRVAERSTHMLEHPPKQRPGRGQLEGSRQTQPPVGAYLYHSGPTPAFSWFAVNCCNLVISFHQLACQSMSPLGVTSGRI